MTSFNLVSNDCDSVDVNYAARNESIERNECRVPCVIDEHLIRNEERRVDDID